LFIGILMPAMRAMTLRYLNLNFMSVNSSLALLVARVGAADHVDNAAPPHDLAVLADFLD
jgi:hypothetical protein